MATPPCRTGMAEWESQRPTRKAKHRRDDNRQLALLRVAEAHVDLRRQAPLEQAPDYWATLSCILVACGSHKHFCIFFSVKTPTIHESIDLL